MAASEEMYRIPARFRRIENLHIVFWLLKDLCWVMLWRPLGIAMIVPTMGAALLITWQTRNIKSELLHNLAVVFWITANAYWMITEFFSDDDSLRYYAVIPFSLGIIVIAYYYIGEFWQRLKKN
ncbi:DUF805 domain-containing protein [Flavobacterium longum]|uniref:hypothetical protein n=1 Tax=Flavobacterium longum TaxID=1299340 RepID=UPI0039EBCBC7